MVKLHTIDRWVRGLVAAPALTLGWTLRHSSPEWSTPVMAVSGVLLATALMGIRPVASVLAGLRRWHRARMPYGCPIAQRTQRLRSSIVLKPAPVPPHETSAHERTPALSGSRPS
jgi:hypothetical protein